ncbi:MAG: hypothetical protein L6R35_001292 [Caloplaca aegaea]|nr:MAG: hypothetical protein L6R35_001292 [Caloplaca aegaea]
MPPAIYHSLLSHYLALLANFFDHVASPIEAPEKDSFGDVDIIVSQPKVTPFQPEQNLRAINAERIISSKPLYSFAVPYPGLEGSYVQLDIQICPLEDFEWEVFHKGHGDLWNLLGSSIRPFGLTANNKGLYLRISEIEDYDRKRSLVFLTANPAAVLDFLRLDIRAYKQSFDTVDDMFEYACSTRFFRPEAYVRDGLKANDRKRVTQRDLYRRFVDVFVPHRSATTQEDISAPVTREHILEEALDQFARRDEYKARVREWRKEREELAHKQVMKGLRKRRRLEDDAYADAWIDAGQWKAKNPQHALERAEKQGKH